jgi:hypothetical protein
VTTRIVPTALLALALVLAPSSTRAGQRSTAFADIDPGPRSAAMGGAAVAVVDDPTATYWNPAGLYFQSGTRATATYDDLYGLGLVSRNYLAVAWKKTRYEPEFERNRLLLHRDDRRGGALGVSLSSVLVDVGEESYNEFIPSITLAGGLGPDIGFGITASYLRASSGIEDAGANGYNVGLGTAIQVTDGLRVAASVRNLLSRVYHDADVAERLAVTPTVGGAWRIAPAALVAGDVSFAEGNSGPSRISVGGEYRVLSDHLALRAGLRRFDGGAEGRTVPSFGLGVNWRRFDVDYALTADDDGPGSTHRFGLAILLARPQ